MKEETLFNPRYLLLPVVIGLGVIGWLFWRECDWSVLASLRPDGRMWLGVALACGCMVCQNLALMGRFRLMTGGKLSWKQLFRVNILCEFTSAATPSSVGGSSLIALYLYKEGLKGGEGTTIMISCLFLDELFLSVACVLVLCFFPFGELFKGVLLPDFGVQWLFMGVLGVVMVWTLVLYWALFHKAEWVKKVLLALFSLPFLRRWKRNINRLTDDLVVSSQEMRGRSFWFWLSCFGMTVWAWCSRYWVVNALIFAFAVGGDQLLAFVRQLVIWVILMISPTPGGSGLSEYMFGVYYADFFPVKGTVLVVALVWRVITYYSYLVAGACVLPYWLNLKKRGNR